MWSCVYWGCLPFPHLEPHCMGGFTACTQAWVGQISPASPAALTHLWGRAPGNQFFPPSQQGKGVPWFASLLVIPGFFSMSRVHQCAPSRSLDRNKAPEDHWLCLLIDSPRSVWSHSKAASLPWPKWSHSSWPNSCFIAFHIIFASCCLWYQNS